MCKCVCVRAFEHPHVNCTSSETPSNLARQELLHLLTSNCQKKKRLAAERLVTGVLQTAANPLWSTLKRVATCWHSPSWRIFT